MSIQKRVQAIRGLRPSCDPESEGLDIRKLDVGGYLDIRGETFQVGGIGKYLDVRWSNYKRRKKEYWVTELEIFNLLTGKIAHVEWEEDDALEMSETLLEIKLRDISCDGKAVTRSDLELMAEDEKGCLKYKAEQFHYSEDESWAAVYYRSRDDDPAPVRLYEFESNSGQCLTIEMWDDDGDHEREAFLSQELGLDDVVVLQASALKAGDYG
ncbi:MAG: hypothetical protein ACI9G5_001686 [Paracoccaceae bacterium]|jgi:hypothetical protein